MANLVASPVATGVEAGGGDDIIFVGTGNDSIDGGIGNATIVGGAGDDTFNVSAPGLGAGGTDFIDRRDGTNQANVDAGGRVVDASTDGQIVIAGTPTLVYANTQTVNVINAANFPLTPIPETVFATEGVPFTDANVGELHRRRPVDHRGPLHGGDRLGRRLLADAGTVVALSGGGFERPRLAHLRPVGSTFPVTVGVTDPPNTRTETFSDAVVTVTDTGGSTTIHSTAVVASATLTGAGRAGHGVEGFPLTAPVATFTSPNSEATAGDFAAVIDWGDGTAPSAGTMTESDGVFTVTGSHTYENHGTYPVTVPSSRRSGPGVLATVHDDGDDRHRPGRPQHERQRAGLAPLRHRRVRRARARRGRSRSTSRGRGPIVIHLASPLSPLDVPAVVDGSTQPGFAGSPIVEVDGSAAGAGDGLVLEAAGAGVRSLAIGGFTQGVGVAIAGDGQELGHQ